MLAAEWFVPWLWVILRVVTPVPTIVTRPVLALMVAVFGLLLEYVMAPSLGEVPQLKRNVESPNTFVMGSTRS